MSTLYRLIVMVAAGVIVVKGWQLYGPPTEKVTAFAVAALEKGQALLSSTQQKTPTAELVHDPRPQGAPLFASETAIAGESAPEQVAGNEPAAAPLLQPAADAGVAPPAEAQLAPDTEPDRLPQLLARLEEIGGAKPELGEWGSSGHLYRCSCRAHLAAAPSFARHFEAVAEEPAAAVEQVVASVEAWRAEQHLSP